MFKNKQKCIQLDDSNHFLDDNAYIASEDETGSTGNSPQSAAISVFSVADYVRVLEDLCIGMLSHGRLGFIVNMLMT